MIRINLDKHSAPVCDRISRRQALSVGGSTIMAGLGLPQLLQLQAETVTSIAPQARACILLFLEGGPSTIDLWDLKPQAPAEIRGPYGPIATSLPGLSIGEKLPHCAKVMDKVTLLRSHSHKDNGHSTGYHYCLTGYKASFPDGNLRIPNNELYPSIGSIISRELGLRSAMPSYINMPNPMAAGGPGFYGVEHAPFVIETDPVQPDFEVRDLRPVTGVNPTRFARRRAMLRDIEQLDQPAVSRARSRTMAKYYEKAYDLLTSPAAQQAFDLSAEKQSLRATYGYTSLGQCSLLARRLVEAGCRFIGVDHGSWDTHFDCFPTQEKDLFPHADMAFSALVNDLDERGLLDTTLVVMMGEMGRTPRINARAGRDHWSMCQSVLFAGGGVKRGQVIGASDQHAAYPTTEPFSIEDLLFSIFTLMGINPKKIYNTPLGRPVPLVNGGRFVTDLT